MLHSDVTGEAAILDTTDAQPARSAREAEFGEFMAVRWPSLVRLAYGLTGDRWLAEDITAGGGSARAAVMQVAGREYAAVAVPAGQALARVTAYDTAGGRWARPPVTWPEPLRGTGGGGLSSVV